MNQQDQIDLVFQAMASKPRRLIMDLVKDQPGCCLSDLCAHFEISRIAVLKHLQVLENAKLIVSRKEGRKRALFFNAAPIQMIYDRWTTEYSAFWASQAVDLKYLAESKARRSVSPSSGKKASRK